MKRNSIIYNVNSFSSLIACCLARLDEQFFSCTAEIFLSATDGSASLEKLACMPMQIASQTRIDMNTQFTWPFAMVQLDGP